MIAALFLLGAWISIPASPAEKLTWPVPEEKGFVSRWECHTGPMSDTLRSEMGSSRRFQLWRNGGLLLRERDFHALPGDTSLLLAATPVVGDTLCFVFQAAPALPNPRVKIYDTSEVPIWRGEAFSGTDFTAARAAPENPDTGAYRLDLSGSKSVSVSVGQGGGVGLDAALFVNLNGQVANNVFLEGSLSDQNVPVQPEGSTANLREVDNKYLRVYGKQYEYLLGDYLLGYGRDGEDRFVAKSEGARLRYARGGAGVAAQYALSKGIFHTDTLRGVDGKQRGYYLRGRDGRTFITVLAGTERLWRNGVLLRRGSDYTIDYAEGRVDFLNALWVSGENLFAAEFQYTEESFPRSVVAAEAADTLGVFRFSLRGVQEWDDKENPALGAPDTASLRRFENLGDSVALDSAGRPVPLPEKSGSAAASAEWEGGDFGHARFTWLGGLQDKNLYSSRDDGNNLGFSTRYQGVHRFGRTWDQGGVLRLQLEPVHEHRSRDFASFHQLVEPRAFRDAWNLDAAVGEKDFDANRLRATLEPRTGFRVGAEGGLAEGRLADSLKTAVHAKRGEVFASAQVGGAKVDLSSEAALASDPRRRDHYRQTVSAGVDAGGWSPKARLLRDEWLESAPGGMLWSRLWQPEASLESPALWNRWVWTTSLNSLYGQSNYSGKTATPEDSLLDIGIAQRLRLLSWGPFSADLFGSRRLHRDWNAQADGSRPPDPGEAVYDQAEADFAVLGYQKGYGLQTHYRVNRTAEVPLVEAYQKVEAGRGDYRLDSLLNAYQRVETGGDYALVGLRRDTTLGQRPYQDLQWSLRLDLSPGRWPFGSGIGGVLADVDLGFDLETDHQDSASDPVPLPRFTDDQIDAARSGKARYEPTLRWRSPTGHSSANARWRREYAKGAGLYAFRERASETEGEYRWEWPEGWEASLGGGWGLRRRQGGNALSLASASHAETKRGEAVLYRHLPRSFTLSPAVEYQRVDGEDAGLPLELQGFTPKVRIEKGSFYGGRASLEYSWHYLTGQGEGSVFATGGYRRGGTHRVEALAQSELQTYLHLNLSYLARLEPGTSSWDQRLTVELRAVF